MTDNGMAEPMPEMSVADSIISLSRKETNGH